MTQTNQFELWLDRKHIHGFFLKNGDTLPINLDFKYELSFSVYSDTFDNAIESIVGWLDENVDDMTIDIPACKRCLRVGEAYIQELPFGE